MRSVTGSKWFRKWANEFDARKIILKDLRTHAFDATTYSDIIALQGAVIRYLPKEYTDFYLAVDVYNDIVVLYDWRNDEVFAVEIQNKNFAKFMYMLFHEMWAKGKER